jgi:hypothetical protein
MAAVRMSFHLLLESKLVPGPMKLVGPLFNRFVPDGQNDAVFLTPEGDPHEVRVWFRRAAKKEGDFLRWDQNGSEFDVATMRRQAKLEGGPLRGEMVMPDVSEAELASLLRNSKALGEPFGQDSGDDPIYVGLARRVVDVLHSRLQNFISTLRNQYGQYWLEEPSAWDSRRSTLGTYCSSELGLLWWNEQTQDWRRFLPTNSGATISLGRLPGRGYEEYLTEEDWRRLQRTRCLSDVSTELQLLGNATRALDFGEYRQSFIEVISALELVVARRLASPSGMVQSAIQSFQNRETQNAQIAVVLLTTGARTDEIEDALKALKVRNRVAHEGYQPTTDDAAGLRNVMKTIQKLAGLEEIKSPILTFTNKLSAP